ncbi:unnamed protein product [Clavelina lepadiformis]|uniref:Uncharacterized protein n=1 Tax=Clavelina lepadiformis TaxID=159417 RepID=A0ABP0FBC2_CLALP
MYGHGRAVWKLTRAGSIPRAPTRDKRRSTQRPLYNIFPSPARMKEGPEAMKKTKCDLTKTCAFNER